MELSIQPIGRKFQILLRSFLLRKETEVKGGQPLYIILPQHSSWHPQ